MSVRDEVLKLIEAEKAKLAERESVDREREERLEAAFLTIRHILEEILLAAPEFSTASFVGRWADIRVGRRSGASIKETIRWDIALDEAGSAFEARVEETRTYDYHGFQPTDVSVHKKEFKSESALAEYIAGEYAKAVASLSRWAK